MDATNTQNTTSQPPAGTLPPEVEAELRRRLQASSAPPAPAPPLAEFSLPGAYPDGGSGVAAVPPKPGFLEKLKAFGPVGVFLVFLLTKLKFLAFAAKFVLPLLKTGGTMIVSVWFYALLFGWRFGVGFVLSILIHEMGHVYAAWRLGIPVSAPIFIPGMGALILQKEAAKSTWQEALIGIGGPVGGTLAAVFCYGLYVLTGNPLFGALAYTGALINLFNMIPIMPLDGGWITGAISPRIWLVGTIAMVGLFATGVVRNPLIIFLVLLSLPRLWQGLKHGDVTPPGGVPVTSHQRLTMGVSYVSLAAFLLWLMSVSQVPTR